MKIRTKLLIAPLLTVIIFAIGGFFIFESLQSVIAANRTHDIEMDELTAISKLPRDLDRIRWSIGEILLGESSKDILEENWKYYDEDSAELSSILSRPEDGMDDGDEAVLISEENSLAIFQVANTNAQSLREKSNEIITLYDIGDLDGAKKKYEEIDGLFNEFADTFRDMAEDNMAEIESLRMMVDSVQRDAQIRIIILLSAASIMSVALAHFNASRMSKELRGVQDVVSDVLGGDFNKRINVISKDEVGDLSLAFNEMIAKVQESNSSLERKVKERTMALETAMDDVEKRIQERTQELSKTVGELKQTNSLMTNRELKMIELKEKIKKLEDEKEV